MRIRQRILQYPLLNETPEFLAKIKHANVVMNLP